MEKAYVARQKIVNPHGILIGYELLFRDHEDGIKNFPSNLKATSQVLLNVLANVNITDVIPANIKAYINVDESVLFSGIIDILDKDIFVLELLETTIINEKIIKKLKEYRSLGFAIAIDDFDCSSAVLEKYKPILKYVTIIKIDLLTANIKNIKKLVPTFKAMGIDILGEKVETKDSYKSCIEIGFDLLQGYYISRPEVITVDIYKEATHIVIMQLIGLIKEDAGISVIKKFIRSRPDLSFKMILYLNNQNNFTTEISSITQVITLMGRDKLMRWLLLYVYAEASTSPISENILTLARNRAEVMEAEAPTHVKEKAYLAGMFSMMDMLFECNMKDIIKHINLDKEIVSVITTKTGRFSDSLKKIEAKEKEDLKEIVCENFNSIRIEDILYALEYGGIKLPDTIS